MAPLLAFLLTATAAAPLLALAEQQPSASAGASAWRQELTSQQRQELDHEMSELQKKAAREESFEGGWDGKAELEDRLAEYARKEHQLLDEFKRKASSSQRKEASDSGGPVLLLASRAGNGNHNASRASAGASAWRQELTSQQRHELAHELADLHRQAAHELHYASQDGEDELEDRKAEFARKEERLIDDFKDKAAEASKARAQHDESGGSDVFILASKEKTSKEQADTVRRAQGHGDREGDDSTNSMKDVAKSAMKDANAWRKEMTSHEKTELGHELSDLHRQATHELHLARQDGKHELEDRRAEYQKQMDKLVDDFKHRVASASQAQHDESGSAVFLLASTEGKDHAKSANAWQQDLTSDQRQKLEHKLSELHKKAAREEGYARKDGKGEFEARRREYARKEDHLLDDFMHAATANKSGSAAVLLLASKAGNESKTSWQNGLSTEERAKLKHKLSRLEEENREQMSFAKEYGPQAVREQKKDYESKVAHVLAHFKGMMAKGSSDSVRLLVTGTSSKEDSAMLFGFCALVATPGLAMTFSYVMRTMHRRTYLAEPLLTQAV